MSGHMGPSGAKDQYRSALTRCGAKAHPEPGRLQFRRSAVTSTSNFISGLTNAHTRQVAAGLISPNIFPNTGPLASSETMRSEERRGGKEGVSGGRTRWSQDH